MKKQRKPNGRATRPRVAADFADTLDEELELEIDDHRLDQLLRETSDPAYERHTLERQVYFQELFRLQGELVKLQDWVLHNKAKIVVIFEGRDSAGKGGVIKRITQRLNPRVCRVAALPAPSERERTRLPARSFCLIEVGITAQASSGSWAFAPTSNARNSFDRCRNSNAC